MNQRECGQAYTGAFNDAIACLKTLQDWVIDQQVDSAQRRDMQLRDICGPYPDETCLKQFQQDHPVQPVTAGFGAFVLADKTRDCLEALVARESTISASCSRVSGNRDLFCGNRAMLAKACLTYDTWAPEACGIFTVNMCADPSGRIMPISPGFAPPKQAASTPKVGRIDYVTLGCGDAIAADKMCLQGCGNNPDKSAEVLAECKKTCTAARDVKLSACLGYTVDSSRPEPKTAGKKTSFTSGKIQSGKLKAEKIESAKVKGGLDRFNLGPSFASPSTGNAGTGTKGARSSGSGGSSKTTTTVAPGVTDQPTKLNVLPGN